MEKKLRISGILIIIGLMVEAISMGWNSPLSFIAFLCIGGFFLAIGILLYLWALVTRPEGSGAKSAQG